LRYSARHCIIPLVIANEVKQSMNPEVMDRHAALAMTKMALAMTKMAFAMTVQGPSAQSGRIQGALNDDRDHHDLWKFQ